MREIVSPLVGFRSPFLNNRGLGGFNLLSPEYLAVTRAGDTATYFDSNGVLRTALANTLRLDHNPATGAFRGLLIEPSRINNLRNSTMVGASAPSTLPTNWLRGSTGGLTLEVLNVTPLNGLPRIRLRFSGTASATSTTLQFDGQTAITAAAGEAWVASYFTRLIDAPAPPLNHRLQVLQRTAAGTIVAPTTSVTHTPSSALERTECPVASLSATTERVQMQYAPSLTNGAAYDWTIEILGVQLELGSVATSFVPTSTAAATANADNAAISVSDFAPIWSAVENTVYCEFELRKNATGLQQSILDLHNGTSDERVQIVVSSAGNVSLFVHAGAVPVVNQTLGAAIVGRNKVAARIKANDMTGALNGVVQAADTSCPIPAVTRAQIGANRAFTANTIMNGWIPVARNILRGLSNSSLASLTD